MIPKKIEPYFKIWKKDDGNIGLVEGVLTCCDSNDFEVLVNGQVKKNLFSKLYLVQNENDFVILKVRCKKCDKIVSVFDSRCDGYDMICGVYDTYKKNQLPYITTPINCKKCGENSYSVEIKYEYPDIEDIESIKVTDQDNAFSWIRVSMKCNKCRTKYKNFIDFETSQIFTIFIFLNYCQIKSKKPVDGTGHKYFYITAGFFGFKYHVFYGGVNSTDYYFYRKNLQGDVIAILDQNGNVVAEYLYDAWGKCYITYDPTGIGEINPIRYRSYYYDTETGLYYLNSRYYDSQTGRFLNSDNIGVLATTPMNLYNKNLYAYCDNNPVVRADSGGTFWHIVVGAVIGGLVSGMVSTASMIVEKQFDCRKFVTSVVIGAISGGLTAAAPGCSVAISSASSALESIVTDCIDGEDPVKIAINAVISAGFGAVAGSWGDDVSNPNLYDDAFDSISKIKSGNHPNVKNNAKKIIRDAAKQLNKTVANELVTAASIELISTPTKKVTICYMNMFY